MATPHQLAVRLALNTSDDLGVLFDDLGSEDNPTGIYGIYASLLPALEQTFDTDSARAYLILGEMGRQAVREVLGVMDRAGKLGYKTGATMLSIYDVEARGAVTTQPQIVAAATEQVLSIVRAQVLSARNALQFGTFDKSAVVGDTVTTGLLTPGPVIREATRMITTTAETVKADTITQGVGATQDQWGWQVQAAIDERTTECCLEAHGQVIPLDGQFYLTGEPHYAEYMSKPPFHWYCRSVAALVRLDQADDALTDEMLGAAKDELAQRRKGERGTTTTPVNAVSRRG